MSVLDPDLLLRAYAIGVFPMADSRNADEIYWVEPRKRAIIPLDGFRLAVSP
jgi:leucyl/phenylalanyl-tRNA--protein transferase